MITETDWAYADIKRGVVRESDLFSIAPYANTIHITLKSGPHLVHAKHDGTDQRGDIETLKTLCLIRFNQGESND
jgi:hypothetical protein